MPHEHDDGGLLAIAPDLEAARRAVEAARHKITGNYTMRAGQFRADLIGLQTTILKLQNVLALLPPKGVVPDGDGGYSYVVPCGGDYAEHDASLDRVTSEDLDVLDCLDRELSSAWVPGGTDA